MNRTRTPLLTLGLLAICCSASASTIPVDVPSAGLSYVVPDMPVWYTTNKLPANTFNGYVTNGPVDLTAQVPVTTQGNGNWEPYVSVVGDSTFLIGSGQFADDGSWYGSVNQIGSRPNQRYVVTIQPATGGAPRNGEVFYDDAGQPYRLHEMMRQRNPGVRVAGDKRIGANNFIAGGTAALIYAQTWTGANYFNTDGRFNTSFLLYGTGFGSQCNQDCAGNPAGTTDFQSVSVQNFSLDTTTLAQTPLTKAFDATYALTWRNTLPCELCNNAGLSCGACPAGGGDNVAYFGGELAALDNGNFVVVVNDYTGFIVPTRTGLPSAVATIIKPDGSIVKDTFLVDPREIWSNVAAYKGGFCVRVQTLLYFFDNAGNPTATNTVNSGTITGAGAFPQSRGDEHRIASDIRSHYVYLAGAIAPPGGGAAVGLAIWDGNNGAFVTNAIVSSDLSPATMTADRVGVAVDSSDRVCVAFNGKADKNVAGIQDQIIARVLKFNGSSVTPVSPSFLPFQSADNSDTIAANGGALGFKTTNPNLAMTTERICIAAKGVINSTNNPAGGPDTSVETTVYTVISNPDATPTMTATSSGGNVVISWLAADGLFRLQSTSALGGSWTDVAPQPTVAQVGNQYTMTVPIGAGNKFFRLAR